MFRFSLFQLIKKVVFWKANKKTSGFLAFTAAVENIYYEGSGKNKLFKKSGVCFVKNAIDVHNGKLFFREIGNRFYWIDKGSIPIVDENIPIDDFPDQFAIKTRNVDLLRELIARGKKITWIEPDLLSFVPDIVNIPFEHLLLDPFITDHIVLPTGKVKKTVCAPKDDDEFKFLPFKSPPKYADLIGFSFKGFKSRFEYTIIIRPGKKDIIFRRMSIWLLLAYYNILSITYMLCQKKLTAIVAKEKTAPKDKRVLYVP